jgi:DNA-binding CsgD family transcriptional regulator
MTSHISEIGYSRAHLDSQRGQTIPLGRAILVGRPCLVLECLREEMNVRGIETIASSFEQGITACTTSCDVFVIFLERSKPDAQALVRQRILELRSQMPQIPAVALVEGIDIESGALSGIGFSTVVLGLPSVPFAVDVVYRLLLTSRHVPDFDRSVHGADPFPDRIEFDQPALAVPNVSFTRREAELLDLLHRGMQNKLIAYELGISQSTVKAHLRSIMMKLNAKNRTQAICKLTQEIGHRTKELTND